MTTRAFSDEPAVPGRLRSAKPVGVCFSAASGADDERSASPDFSQQDFAALFKVATFLFCGKHDIEMNLLILQINFQWLDLLKVPLTCVGILKDSEPEEYTYVPTAPATQMCAIEPSARCRGWMKKKKDWMLQVCLLLAQSRPCCCRAGGLVPLHVRGWRGLKSGPPAAPRSPAGAVCPGGEHAARPLRTLPGSWVKWGSEPPPSPKTTTTTSRTPSAARPPAHTQSRCQIRDSDTDAWYLASRSTGRRCAQIAPTLEATLTSLCLIIDDSIGWFGGLPSLSSVLDADVSADGLEPTGGPDHGRALRQCWRAEDEKLCTRWTFF